MPSFLYRVCTCGWVLIPQHPPPHCILQDANLGSETEPSGGAVLGLHSDCPAMGEVVEGVGGGARKEELRVLLGVWVPWETPGCEADVRWVSGPPLTSTLW